MNVVVYLIAAVVVASLLWFVTRKTAKKKPEGRYVCNVQFQSLGVSGVNILLHS